MSEVFVFIWMLTNVLAIAIIVRALLSWFPMGQNPFTLLLDQVTEPVLAPLRRVVPRLGVFDITPIVAILLLQLIGTIAQGLIRG
jgi:YggT family protein